MSEAITRSAEDGESIWFAQSLLSFKATSAETNGSLTMLEFLSPRGKVTPLHLHDHEESFRILDGELLLHVDGVERRAGAGDFASVPRGVPHAFMVVSETARYLVPITPGSADAEAFFREAGDPAPDGGLPPEAPLDIERLQATAERHTSIELLGPPPFAPPEQEPADAPSRAGA